MGKGLAALIMLSGPVISFMGGGVYNLDPVGKPDWVAEWSHVAGMFLMAWGLAQFAFGAYQYSMADRRSQNKA